MTEDLAALLENEDEDALFARIQEESLRFVNWKLQVHFNKKLNIFFSFMAYELFSLLFLNE